MMKGSWLSLLTSLCCLYFVFLSVNVKSATACVEMGINVQGSIVSHYGFIFSDKEQVRGSWSGEPIGRSGRF